MTRDDHHPDQDRDEGRDSERRVLPFPSPSPSAPSPSAAGPERAGESPVEGDDEALSRLLELAGPRPEPPAEVRRRVHRAVHAAWREKVGEHARSRRRRFRQLAAAAVLAVAVGLALWAGLGPGIPSPEALTVARVETVTGPVTVRTVTSRTLLPPAESEPVPLEAGDPLPAGSVLESGSKDGSKGGAASGPDARGGGRAALRLAGGASLRLDRGTRVQLASARELVLERGALYLDTGDGDPGAPSGGALEGEGLRPLAVRTPLGVARDVGTQFEVRLAQDSLRVRVREGRVEVDTGARSHAAAAGVALIVDPRGRVERHSIPRHGAGWDWIQAASPSFELEGATLAGYLDWLARETGWRIRYGDRELSGEAEEITLHGSLEGLRPDETPAAVLPGAGLGHRLESGTLWIERPEEG